MKINKMTVIFIILIVWFIGSVVYIAYDAWRDFKINYVQAAVNQGRQEGQMNAYGMVGQALIQQVKDGCKDSIPLNLGKDESGKEIIIGLVNAECLKPAENSQATKEKK